jgi:hypothetical protein
VTRIRCARGVRDGSIYVYGLAEEKDGGGWSLVFSHDEMEEDGSYSLSTPDGATCYDALRGWRLVGNILELNLSEVAATTLGLAPDLKLQLDIESVSADDVRTAMTRLANPA